MLARRLATRIAPRTAFHIRAVLRTALNAAILQLIATNPAARAEAPDVPNQEMLTLSTKEVGELIKLGQDHRDGPLWVFLVGSGVRLGTALCLRWTDYDAPQGPGGHTAAERADPRPAPHLRNSGLEGRRVRAWRSAARLDAPSRP